MFILDLFSWLWGHLFWRPHYEDPVAEAVGSNEFLDYTVGCNDGTPEGTEYVEYERGRTDQVMEQAEESLDLEDE